MILKLSLVLFVPYFAKKLKKILQLPMFNHCKNQLKNKSF